MTKKRNLTTFMIAIMIMLFSLPANAQGKVGYAQWDVDSNTLTFYGGESVPEGDFGLNTGYDNPGWNVISIRESVTKVVFDESFKDVRPTSCYRWFRLFSKLKTIEGIENLNTEEVTNMGDMFNSCKGLENLDLSSFNTAKVEDMGYMFSGSNGLTSLDLSSFNTAKVEDMSCMFSGCYGLASLDLSSFNTAEVTDMRGMFGECSGLTSLDLSSFNTAKVTNMNKMFSDCSSLNKIYVSNYFATSEGISSENMFYNCTNLIGNVPFDSNNIDHTMANYTSGYFTESNLKSYVKWNADTKVLIFKVANYIEGTAGECEFNEGAIALEGVDLKNNCKKVVFTPSFKQVKPTSCYSWFDSFSNLTTIQGIENLNTEEVTNMMFMFYGCKKLTSLDLSSFNTAKVTNMNGMFGSCSSLTSLDVSSFDTDEVEEMSYMFGNCTGLKSLDLSSFNTAKVTDMGYMFGGCSGLTSLNLSSFNTAKVMYMMNMFVGCKGLTSLDLSSFNTANVEVMSYMFNGCSGLTTIYVSDDFTTNKVSESNDMFSSCSNLKGATSYDSGKTGIDMANFDGYFTPKIITPYVKWDANTKVLTFKVANTKEEGSGVYDLNEGANAPEWVGEVYSDCEKVVFTPSFKQAKPTSCCQWFLGFSKLTTIEGIENLNTEEVTDMSEMFNSCSGLKNLDLSSFNTAKVTNMGYMFGGCYDLISLDLSSFNTAKVTDMTWMFYNCQSLTTIYVSDGFTTGEVSSSDGMFESCFTLEGATPWDITKTGIDMANFDGYFTPKIITPYVKWDANTKVLTFKVANTKEEGSGVYDLNEGANAPEWVGQVCSDCEKVVFTPSFKQAKPTSCYKWFENFRCLTTIEGIENLNTEEVTDMRSMFSNCRSLTSLDLSKFNTAKVTAMSDMFRNCWVLTSLDLSKFNTAKVTDMSGMFYYCKGLTSLDLSKFNTAEVTDMSNMFSGCSGLTSLNLSNFNTDKVTNMFSMFYLCSGLTSLDLSSFDTAEVTNMGDMFGYCSGLTSLDVSKFNTAKVTNMRDMFCRCQGLTSLDLSSFNTAEVTSMSFMFWDCSKLTSLDLSSFNTAKVTTMRNMFDSCQGLTSLDLSSFNTAEVTNMGAMFSECHGLTSLDLSSFNTAKVTNMNFMFGRSSKLTTIYVSDDFTTDSVSNSDNMFEGCSQLEGAAQYTSDKLDHSMANYTSGYFKTYFALGEKKVELCGEPLTTKVLDLSGDYDFTPKYNFTAASATYSRDLSTSGSTWFSLCLPFAYTPDNFTAYKLKGATAEAVEIEELTGEIVAGTPVLFKFKDGVVDKTINLSATEAEIVKAPVDGAGVNGNDGSSLQLCGTYQAKTFSSEDNNAFILLNDKLMNPAKILATTGVAEDSVKPFCAYMTLTASAEATPAPASARAFSIGRGDEGGGTTAIDLLNSVATDDAEYYDINGRRIDAPAKGVNIVRRGNKTIKLIIK